MKRTTIKDIAAHLGISVSTVSRALQDHQDISVKTRERVKETAKLLHYHPNKLAANLRTNRSYLVAFIVPEISNFFIPSVTSSLTNFLSQKGYRVLVMSSNGSHENEIENIQISIDNGVDGIIIALCQDSKTIDHLQLARDTQTPLVIFDKSIQHQEKFDEVLLDDVEAGRKAAQYLVDQGCKEVVAVYGSEDLSLSQSRKKGFDSLAAEVGLKIKNVFADSADSARRKILDLNLGANLDGIFMMSEEVLIGTHAALFQNANHNVTPKMIAISDGSLPDYLNPAVPYFHHNGNEVGELTASTLINRIEKKSTDVEKHFVGLTLSIPPNA